jgi:hypothetical protein
MVSNNNSSPQSSLLLSPLPTPKTTPMSPKVQINGKSKIYISALDKTSLIDSPVKAAGTLQYLFSRSPNDVSFDTAMFCESLHYAFSL